MSLVSNYPERLDAVRGAVEAFWSNLAPSVPRPQIVTVTDRAWSDEQWRAYPRQTRIQDGIGAYLHFSQAGELLYVGMTISGFDRCWGADSDERHWIDGIRIEPAYDFLIPALELFLIRRLRPRNNRPHRKHPTDDDNQ